MAAALTQCAAYVAPSCQPIRVEGLPLREEGSPLLGLFTSNSAASPAKQPASRSSISHSDANSAAHLTAQDGRPAAVWRGHLCWLGVPAEDAALHAGERVAANICLQEDTSGDCDGANASRSVAVGSCGMKRQLGMVCVAAACALSRSQP